MDIFKIVEEVDKCEVFNIDDWSLQFIPFAGLVKVTNKGNYVGCIVAEELKSRFYTILEDSEIYMKL